LSDDPFDGTKLNIAKCPVLITLARIGNYCIVDPTPEEEACTAASLVVGVTPDGQITTMRKMGAGSFHHHTLAEAIKLGTITNLFYFQSPKNLNFISQVSKWGKMSISS